ncbi:hypothetical protein OFS07_15225 [Brachyspira hyodysenteriae]|uniref:hypothetical protein n=1 Tax=Brachyspira hyodysenteriae TaxID=159 RepID=UPI00063D9E4A|nr:hypothetical protein [Brachyspira hyodysenteriae]KLI30740.1 hypothetical protein SZ49_05485 [Brachyspira hyodysenteriae]KLI54268.1 hypothetical protein SZ43_04510 [Brachyspira hyodysenteriae]MDA0063019.1 hypothetical protein [Brachyspira hyodysenteriae]MDA0065036.1 hypothetical protein [Brachyspira hyodysenteriae]MDA0067609.1 hypothetical protein [Brachyspira hyodysenteriae]
MSLAQKIDPYQSINNNIANQINKALKRLPKSQPCKVEEVKGNKVKVARMLENDNTIGYTDDVPIIRPIYFTYPIKQGDLGILIALNYPYESYIKDYNTPPKDMPENSNGSGYLFLPLAPDNIDFNKDTEGKSFEIYSLDGKTSIIINDDKIEIKDNASGDDEGDNNNILIDENGINITDTNKNNILLNSDGMSITDTNGNVIEMGTTSVKINNNLEVLQ